MTTIQAPYRDATLPIEQRVADLLARGDPGTGFRVRRLMVPTHAEIREWARALGRALDVRVTLIARDGRVNSGATATALTWDRPCS